MSDEPKVGSSDEAAKQIGGDGDFGAPADDQVERAYAAKTVQQHEPGEKEMRSHGEGTRTAGVGGNSSGRASSSGGDVDAGDDSLIGLGDPNKTATPADNPPEHAKTQPIIDGSTVRPTPDVEHDGNTGAANVNNPARNDDAFAGEITPGEATGQG
jgi:hypothetical protein